MAREWLWDRLVSSKHIHGQASLSLWISKELSMEVTKLTFRNCGDSLGLSRRTWCDDRAPYSTRHPEEWSHHNGTLRFVKCCEHGAYAKKGRFPLQGKKGQESGLFPSVLQDPHLLPGCFMQLTSRADLEHHRTCSHGVCANLFH